MLEIMECSCHSLNNLLTNNHLDRLDNSVTVIQHMLSNGDMHGCLLGNAEFQKLYPLFTVLANILFTMLVIHIVRYTPVTAHRPEQRIDKIIFGMYLTNITNSFHKNTTMVRVMECAESLL